MKKVLSILGLIAILGMSAPAFAAPGGHGPGGHGGHGPHGGGGHRIHAGAHHRPHIAPPRHHHGGMVIHSGYHHPRHSHWHGYRTGYWGSPWCDYRLGWYDPYCYPYRPLAGVYFPVGGAGVSIRF